MRLRRERRYFLLGLLLILLSVGSVHDFGIHEATAGWKFALVSDTQGDNRDASGKSCINDLIVKKIAEDIIKERPDFVLVAGDLVNGWFRHGGTDYSVQYANWKSAMDPVYRAGIRVYPVRGNHDSGPERIVLPPLPAQLEPPAGGPASLKEAYRKTFSQSYIPTNGPPGEEGLTYSFTHKNAFVVGLDQFDGHQHRVDQAWLDRQLVENKEPHIFVYGHEPAFQVRHKDNLAFYPRDRDAFWDAIGRAGGRIYFCGHDHFYNRALIRDKAGNPIRQIVAGTGGGRLVTWSGIYSDAARVTGEYNNSDHHGYVLVTVEGLQVNVEWKALLVNGEPGTWRILDSLTYTVPARPAGMEQDTIHYGKGRNE